MANPKMYKLVLGEYPVIDSILSFYEEILTLAEEAREIVDNAPESLQSSPRNVTLSDTADILERLQAPDPPATPEGVVWTKKTMQAGIYVPRRRSDSTSRAQRLENAAMLAASALSALSDWLDETEAADETWKTKDRVAQPDWMDEWRQFLDTIQDHIDEAQSVEFPGMRG
jgi:hypothetical protein